MIGIDTNVLIRFLVDDDPDQNARAKAFLSARSFSDPAFVSAVTLAETVWVLTQRLKFPVAAVVKILRELLASEGLIVEHAEQLGSIVFGETEPRADIADYLIAWAGAANGCTHTVTFDRRAISSVAGMELLT
jgi:predicted nucleic-acid-binding protein